MKDDEEIENDETSKSISMPLQPGAHFEQQQNIKESVYNVKKRIQN